MMEATDKVEIPQETPTDHVTIEEPVHIHDKIVLYVKETVVILEPITTPDDSTSDCLVIDRIDYGLSLKSKSSLGINGYEFYQKESEKTEQQNKEEEILLGSIVNENMQIAYGVLGVIPLLAGNYLIVITGREKVCSISGKDIYKVTETTVVQIPVDLLNLTEDEKRIEREYVELLENFLDTSQFYFSLTYDITQSAERISQFSSSEKTLPSWKRVDSRFFWNGYLLRDLIKSKIDLWILPVIEGFIHTFNDTINDRLFTYILISRRGCGRTGARYLMRGADPQGHVANFVETEQLIESEGIVSSFVQIRGSIPLIWSQKGKALKPKPTVEQSLFTKLSLNNHFDELTRFYGNNIVAVNLIDQVGGHEADLCAHFESQMKLFVEDSHPTVRYVAFDFHAKCKGNKYENVSFLLEEVKPELTKYGYYLQDFKGNAIFNQTGIFRTNCIDCLDRTNVVQSVFANFMLKTQLNHLGMMPSDGKLEQLPKFEIAFKNIWADNADRMSIAYAGTGALKTDFTRTGKRNLKGMASDGLNSMKRYINQQFQDEDRQQSIDLFLGKFLVGKLDFIDGEGVYRYTVTKMEEEDTMKDASSAYLEINTKTYQIIEYQLESGQKREFPFSTLKQVEKSFSNYRLLKLIFGTSNSSYYYTFSSVQARQRFIELVSEHCLKYSIPKALTTSENVSMFIGNWNMVGMKECPTLLTLSHWIPQKAYDVVVIATQGGSYEVPSTFSSKITKYYWFYLIEHYFGSAYHTLATSSTNKNNIVTDIILLVKEDQTYKISNIKKSKAKYKVIEKSKVTGNFLMSKLQFAKDKIKEAKDRGAHKIKDSLEQTVIGSALTFRIQETSVCIVNCIQNKNILGETSILLENETDIAAKYNHVFYIGNSDYTVNGNKWNQLNTTTTTITNNNGLPLYWRSLPNTEALSTLDINTPSVPLQQVHYPLAASFSLKVARDTLMTLKTCKIVLSDLRSAEMPVNSKADSYLIIHGSFIEHGIRTPLAKKLSYLLWPDIMELWPFFSDLQFLRQRYLNVELWHRDRVGDEYVSGYGVIPLNKIIDNNTADFECNLTLEDQPYAVITGKIQVVPVDPSSVKASSPETPVRSASPVIVNQQLIV